MLLQMARETSRKYFRESLTVYLEEVLHENVGAFAEYIHCPRSILQSWLDGRRMPRLDSLLRISQALNVSVAGLFIREKPIRSMSPLRNRQLQLRDSATSHHPELGTRFARHCGGRSVRIPRLVFQMSPRRLGYTTTERLYQADRKLCHRIAARYRQSGKSHWWRKPGATRICDVPRLQEILEESLESHEPVSVHHIAARLGYSNDGYLQKKFPDLCAAISKKVAERKQAHLEELHRTLENALGENPPPTLAELESPVELYDLFHLENA